MGALHAGHGALIDRARTAADLLVVTVFVNPIQFDRKEDYQAYATNLEADRQFCAARNVDVVFLGRLEPDHAVGPRLQLGSMRDEEDGAPGEQALDRRAHRLGARRVEVGGRTSRITSGASRRNARASAIRRTCPADSGRPPSPTTVS
jgi:hypothetical protein